MSRILILGAGGMLGHVMLRVFAADPAHEVWGTVRNSGIGARFTPEVAARLIGGIDVEDHDALVRVFTETRPDLVINCIGIVKQLADADDPLVALPINAILPHRLARLCALVGARFVHISTDCVFNGRRGGYRESAPSDAEDLYGRSKFLGEVAYPHTVTLRTSIIGPELGTPHGLIGWFLSQSTPVKGYRRVIFSGVPTVELARIVRDVVLPDPQLTGLYHVAAAPISKHDLLNLVGQAYGSAIAITPDDTIVVDRSLNADRFRAATGYVAPQWPELVTRMRDFK